MKLEPKPRFDKVYFDNHPDRDMKNYGGIEMSFDIGSKQERIIIIANYLRTISGIAKIIQKEASGAVTVYYTDGTTECAIWAGNILDLSSDYDKVADIIEFVRKHNGHAINTYSEIQS